tara:strand:+ start:18073 stop:18330 length:258 start_codon:yes stop_codon:yes gene_type:complete
MSENIETITFDNEQYNVSDLNEQAVQHFNILMKLQNESNEQSYQLSKTNIAIETMSDRFKALLDELDIKPVEETVIDTETKTIEQ